MQKQAPLRAAKREHCSNHRCYDRETEIKRTHLGMTVERSLTRTVPLEKADKYRLIHVTRGHLFSLLQNGWTLDRFETQS